MCAPTGICDQYSTNCRVLIEMITDLLVTEPPAGCPMGTGHAPFIVLVHGDVIDGIGRAELLEGVCSMRNEHIQST